MNDTFSKNLRKLRLDKQMTQEQVADKLGVNLQEHGKLFYRLVAEFGDAYRYDDFMAAVAEYERL